MIESFPPVEVADPRSGLLAIGGDLDVGSLELAYRSGIFPWPVEGEPLLWFAPVRRAIIEFDELKVGSRLQRFLKTASFRFRVNTNFAGVIKNCADSSNRKGQRGTWITSEMIAAFSQFQQAGYAQSFEVYDAQDELVGGLYGVLICKYFAGESMFHKQSNASKFALIQTIQYLQTLGLTWMDVQVLTPFLANFGAKEIPRDLFMKKLGHALKAK